MTAPGGAEEAGAGDEAVGATSVTKRYRDGDRTHEAVRDLSVSVPRGVLWAIRGPSGSGKTTLLGLLGGVVPPTRGEVRIAGESIAHMRDHHRTRWRRQHVGFVFQELSLVPKMSLWENVMLPLVPLGGPTRAQVERAEALLERFGMLSRRAARVSRLSGGERQRGCIARALVHDPRVLLLDEPTAHLDGDNAARIVDLLADLRGEGRTIVAATHDPRLADDPRVDRVRDLVDGAWAS